MPVHTTAIIDPRAEIDPSAEIGPYVVVDGPVRVGRRTRVIAGAYLAGETEIGANRGTQAGTWTEIGDDNYLMSHAHVGHNCRLGNCVVHQFRGRRRAVRRQDDCCPRHRSPHVTGAGGAR